MSSEHPAHSAQHHASKFTSRQRTIALTIVALAFVMDLLDTTIVNIAIPSIQSNLGASFAIIQWLIAGYSLAFAVLLITGGRMGDVFGYKKLFMWGVAGFTLASLLSGLAWNPEVLVGARIVQGMMAALMVPQVMSLMQIMYKPNERGKVMGLFGALGGLSASLGPIIGGILINANIAGSDWRPIFLINVPVGIFAFLAASRYLPNGKSPHPLKLDLVGTFLVILALLLLVFPLIQGRELDWPAWSFWMMAAAVPIFGIFAWWQLHKDRTDHSPLIMPVLFKKRSFSMGMLSNIVYQGVMAGFFLSFTLMLQIGLGFDVIKAALTGLPIAIGIGLSIGVVSQKLMPKLGRYTISLGAIIMTFGLSGLYWIVQNGGLDLNPWFVAPALLVIGLGMGTVMAPIFSVALTDVDSKHAGSASGVLNAIQQLGGAIGIAIIGVFFFGQLQTHAAASFDSVSPDIRSTLTAQHVPAQVQDGMIDGIKTCFVDRTKSKDANVTPESCKKLEQSTGPATPASKQIADTITASAKKANANNFIDGFRIAVIYELFLVAITFGLSFLLPRYIRPQETA